MPRKSVLITEAEKLNGTNDMPKKEEEDKNQKQEEESSESGDLGESTDEADGKDTKPGGELEESAAKLAEDPFLTDAEKTGMDEDTKKKTEQADKEEGEEESNKKEEVPKKAEKVAKKDLHKIVKRSEETLFKAKAIFPFDFFPNTIIIDANKINILIKTFFFTETATSVLLKEVMDVRVESTLFFGKLIIDYGPHPLKIATVYVPSMKKSDALKAKEIIEGILVLYRSENINTADLKPEDTMEEIKEVGKQQEKRA